MDAGPCCCRRRLARSRRQSGLLRRTRESRSLQLLTLPARRARLLRLTRPLQLLLSGTVLLTRLLLLSRTVLRTGLLLNRPVLQARLLPGAILSRQSVLLRSAARRIEAARAGVGAAEVALLAEDAAAEILRRVDLTDKALVAQHHLRRDR